MQELPKYRSHKVVQAVKIGDIFFFTNDSATVDPLDAAIQSFRTRPGWKGRFQGNHEDPGYYVRYEDGYESWSPSKAFEEGYSPIKESSPEDDAAFKDGIELAAVRKALREVRASNKEYPARLPAPTVNRAVHYTSYGTPGGEFLPEARAATITYVNLNPYTRKPNGDVSLFVANPTGLFLNQNVPFSEEPKPGHWNWPPRN